MAGKGKTYTPEFKPAAVKMITDPKRSVAEVARRRGVTENRLHDRKKALATTAVDAFPGSGHVTPLGEENRRLRAEVQRLEAERDSRKTATAFFAARTNRSSPGSRNAAVHGPSCGCAASRRCRGRGSTRGGRVAPVPPTSDARS